MNYPQLWKTSGLAFSLLLFTQSVPMAQAGGHTVRGGETFTSIAKKYKVSVTTLQKANPSVKPGILAKGQSLKVPVTPAVAPIFAKQTKSEATRKKLSPAAPVAGKTVISKAETNRAPSVKPAKRVPSSGIITYRVRQGDTATALARRSGISVGEFAEMNGLDRLHLQEGQKLVLPAGASTPATAPAPSPQQRGDTVDLTPPAPRSKTEEAPLRRPTPSANPPTTQGTYYHVVKRGETFSSIAREKRVSVAALTKANQAINPARLAVGQSLNVPAIQVVSRQPLQEMIDLSSSLRTRADRSDVPEDDSGAPFEGTVPTLAYRITAHDSAETLAREFNTTPVDLRHMNQMGPFDQFKPGNFIRVPWHSAARAD